MQNVSKTYQQLKDKTNLTLIDFLDGKMFIEHLLMVESNNRHLFAVGFSKKLLCDMTDLEYNSYQVYVETQLSER
jgi:hypothetical protein